MSLFTIFDRPCRGASRMIVALLLALAALAGTSRGEAIVDFQDLSLGPNSYWNGSDSSGGFTSRGAHFNNSYDQDYGSWSGWSYSNVNDTTTAGYGNLYAAHTGTGVGGSGNYAVGYVGDPIYGGVLPTITIPDGMQVQSATFTNTTYAALSMLNGDGFAKKFGGSTGNDPDWFELTITGEGVSGNTLGSVDFFLADYRFTNNTQDYLANTWQSVDLSSLSGAKTLEFNLTSSDSGLYGMNTPASFAMDNLTLSPVPEPSTLALLCGAGIACAVRGYRRRSSLPLAALDTTEYD